MFVGGKDLPEDPNWLDDFGMRGLALDTDSGEGGQQVRTYSHTSLLTEQFISALLGEGVAGPGHC
jgi:hypothetical protein